MGSYQPTETAGKDGAVRGADGRTFEERLVWLLDKHEITRADLARHLNVPAVKVSRWTTGRYRPEVEGFEDLADYFGCTVDFLLGRSSGPGEYWRPVVMEPSPDAGLGGLGDETPRDRRAGRRSSRRKRASE